MIGENSMPETPCSSRAADSTEIEEIIVSICIVTSVPSRLMRGRKFKTMPTGKYSMPLLTDEVVAVVLATGIWRPT